MPTYRYLIWAIKSFFPVLIILAPHLVVFKHFVGPVDLHEFVTGLGIVLVTKMRIIKSINFCVNENPKDLAIVRYGYIGSVRGIGKSISWPPVIVYLKHNDVSISFCSFAGLDHVPEPPEPRSRANIPQCTWFLSGCISRASFLKARRISLLLAWRLIPSRP